MPASVCDLSLLVEFVTDCASPPDPPRVTCPCCTRCTSDNDRPVEPPVSNPVSPPVSSPVSSPMSSPVSPPVSSPVSPPVSSPTEPPTSCRVDADTRARDIVDVVLGVSELNVLTNTTSPQYGALQYIINTDEAQVCADDPQLLQRYTLATYYYATEGDSWFQCSANVTNSQCSNNQRWLTGSQSECNWFGVQCATNSESGSQVIVEVVLRKYYAPLALLTGVKTLSLIQNI
jgi:hypothetical protein